MYKSDEIKYYEKGRKCESSEIYEIFLSENLKGKYHLGMRRRGWDGNIEMDLREIRYEHVDWIHLLKDRVQWRGLMSTKMDLRFPRRGIS